MDGGKPHPYYREIMRLWRYGRTIERLGAIVAYIVMEYAQGGDLQKRLTSGLPYPLADTLDIFSQLCSAVSYAHEHGIIHRDLKPLNILFRELPDGGEQVVLSDFGLAVEMEATHHTFARGGTLPYMSPEQLLRGRVEAASDIFALGVILYQLCTGRLPFRRSLQDLRRADAFALPPPPSSFEPSLPAALDEAILTALAEEPAARYADAEQFWHTVQDSISSLQTSTRNRSLPICRSGNAQRGHQTRILRDSSPFSTEPHQTSHPTRSNPNSLSGRSSRPDVASSSARSTLDSHPAASRHFQTRILPPEDSSSAPSQHSYGSLGLVPPDPDATPVLSEPEIDTDAGDGGRQGDRKGRPYKDTAERRYEWGCERWWAWGASSGRACESRPVSARQVTSSQAQSQAVQASGHRQVQATRAKGQLTFFNSAFVAQKIPAGTAVIRFGSDMLHS